MILLILTVEKIHGLAGWQQKWQGSDLLDAFYVVDRFRKQLNAETLLVAMVETPNAIDSIDEIASVEGIDVIMIGTNDLAMASGCPQDFGNIKIQKFYEKTALACEKYNKSLGSGGVKDEEFAKNYIAMGANFFLAGQDIGFLLSASKDRVDLLRS